METTRYEVRPEYQDAGRGRRLEPIGYRVHNTVSAVLDTMDNLGGVFDQAMAAGANRISNLSFFLEDCEQAYLETLGKAMDSARRQAEVLAAASGLKLGDPLKIRNGGPVHRQAGMAMMATREAATPIEGHRVRVSATVTASFELIK